MMKKFLLLAFAMLISSAFMAQNLSNLVVYSEKGEKFTLLIDGDAMNPVAQAHVKAENVTPGFYKIRVEFENQTLEAVDKAIALEAGMESTVLVKQKNNGSYTLRFQSQNAIVQTSNENEVNYEAPSTTTTTTTVNTTTTETTEQQTGSGSNDGVSMNVGISDDGENVSLQMNVSDGTNNENVALNMNIEGSDGEYSSRSSATVVTTTTTATSQTVTTSQSSESNQQAGNSRHYNMPGYSGPVGCPWPMNEADFQSAKQTIAAKDFEDSKLTIAKQVAGANCLFASQVKEIMLLFDFEDTRLEFAKYAYHHTYDIGNYYMVNDAFDFEMTIDELNDYISVNRH